MLALHGKKIGFDKVIKMIDEMVELLKEEQVDDNNKKEYCATQLDSSDDKKKALERSVSDLEAAIGTAEEGIVTLKDEIAALDAGIKALDKSVAEATEQRKEQSAEYKELMANDSAARELLLFAKNRLNKFYNPKLYNPPEARELSAGDRIYENEGGHIPEDAAGGIAGTGVMSLAEISAHVHHRDAPPPPPETLGPYTKSKENTGVIAMIDLLVTDLDKEMAAAEVTEKDAQAEYDAAMKYSAEKRALDSKSITEKVGTRASLEGDLEAHNEAKASAASELAATLEYIHSLHMECDWLLKYFDVRGEARASEIDALGRAKAILSGASFSLAQTHGM